MSSSETRDVLANACTVVLQEILPTLADLEETTKAEGNEQQNLFFEHIRRGLEGARETQDLADPFLQLSTSAFRGFQFSPDVAVLLDRLLAAAQGLSVLLAAEEETRH